MSDHVMISCTYNNKHITKTQQFRIIRNHKLLMKHNLNQYLSHNDIINTIFNYTDPNVITEILVNEISLMIECIAPSQKVQCSHNYTPWITEEYRSKSKIKDILHSKVKITNSEDNWR